MNGDCHAMATTDPQEAERKEYDQFLKTLGAHIRAMRKQRGWTLRNMVVNHGFHISAWQSYEAGRVGMSIPSLIRVAKALGTHPGDLLKAVPLEFNQDLVSVEAKSLTNAPRKRIGVAKRK